MEELVTKVNDCEIKYNKAVNLFLEGTDFIYFYNKYVPKMFDHNFLFSERNLEKQIEIDNIEKLLNKKINHIFFSAGFLISEKTNQFFLNESFKKNSFEIYVYKTKTDYEKINDLNLIKIENKRNLQDLIDFNFKNDVTISETYAIEKSLYNKYLFENNIITFHGLYYKKNFIGYLEVFNTGDEIKIENLTLDYRFRGKGFGHNMILSLIRNSKLDNKLIYIVTDTKENLSSFYNGLGFEKISTMTSFLNSTQLKFKQSEKF